MIHVGVIGYGYWGPNLVRNFSEIPGARVSVVSDLVPERLARVRLRYPTIRTTPNHHDVFADSTIDAVVIATPVSTHFDLASQALLAGKHVLVEKPLTATVAEGEKLLEIAQQSQRVLMVDHTFVYSGAVRKIKELMDAQELGRLYYYDSVRVNLGLFQHDVNVLWDLAVHDLSIMDYVLKDRPHEVSATGIAHFPGRPQNMAYLTCFFRNNFIAHLHVNWLAPVKIRRTLIGGDHRMIVYDDLEPSEKIKVYDKGITVNDSKDSIYRMLVGYRAGDMHAPQLDAMEALRMEALHFVSCIQQGLQPITSGRAGLRVVRILEAATKSMLCGGRPVKPCQSGAVESTAPLTRNNRDICDA